MPSIRTGPAESLMLALEDLAELGALLDDISIVVTGPDQVSIQPGDGGGWPAKVIVYEAVGEAQARNLVATAARGHKFVVANRISETARRYLSGEGWAWLDRRIGAHLRVGRRDIEVRFAGIAGARASGGEDGRLLRVPRLAAGGPIRGQAGLALAAALLCHPADPPSLRSVAAAVGLSPTALSNAAKHLAEAGLVSDGNKPTLPDLFWALAPVWRPLHAFAVASAPEPHSAQFTTRVDRLEEPGWALGGDRAALELGAPVFSVEQRPWLWVPTQVELRRAHRALGPTTWEERAAVIAAPPTPLVCRWRRPPGPGGEWPLPHPVFAALGLAIDPGRGRDILDQWSLEGVDAVWK